MSQEIPNNQLEQLEAIMPDYFKKHEIVEITYIEELQEDGHTKFVITLNGFNFPEVVFRRLGKWLTRSNKVVVKSEGEVRPHIPTLYGLNVELVDFSGVKFKNEVNCERPLLMSSKVGEVVLPTYPEIVFSVKQLLKSVKVDKPINFTTAFQNSKINSMEELFRDCKFDVLDFSGVDLSAAWRFVGTFGNLIAESIILPKKIGIDKEAIVALKMFTNCYVEEILNLEYFPFEKLTNGDMMFYNCGAKEIEIKSKFSILHSAEQIFAKLSDTVLKLPETSRLPGLDDWFMSSKGCEIHIPKLNVGRAYYMRKLDDSNEIFCNKELAEKLTR